MINNTILNNTNENPTFLLSGIFSYVMKLTPGGGNIEFKPLGIRAVVPPNAVPASETELIMISVITKVSKYIPVREDEILVAFGVQCLPNGLELPVSIIIPHCAPSSRLDEVIAVVYSGSGEIGFILFFVCVFCFLPRSQFVIRPMWAL